MVEEEGNSVFRNMKEIKVKRSGPIITRAVALKIVHNKKTPPQLRKYWKKRFNIK